MGEGGLCGCEMVEGKNLDHYLKMTLCARLGEAETSSAGVWV